MPSIRHNDEEREPQHLRAHMNLYRAGETGLPYGYVLHHERVAREELDALVEHHGIRVVERRTVGDGWGDSMRVAEAIIETPSKRLLRIRYHDGNRAYMRACDGGGHAILFAKDLA